MKTISRVNAIFFFQFDVQAIYYDCIVANPSLPLFAVRVMSKEHDLTL